MRGEGGGEREEACTHRERVETKRVSKPLSRMLRHGTILSCQISDTLSLIVTIAVAARSCSADLLQHVSTDRHILEPASAVNDTENGGKR